MTVELMKSVRARPAPMIAEFSYAKHRTLLFLKGMSQYLGFALAERRTLKHYGELVPVDGFETCDELDGHETSDG